MRARSVTLTAVLWLVLTALPFVVFAPALGLPLIGDDYQWIQHARAALRHPGLLMADLDTFYRPASTWTLCADLLMWGHRAQGFRITNLALGGAAAALLFLAARRLGMPVAWAFALAALWVASPFAEEPLVSVAIRFEVLLLACWLGVILAWPREGKAWTVPRAAGVAGLVFLAAMSKETWVVTPALVLVLEVTVHRVGWRRALRATALVCAPVLAYVAAYFRAFPGGKGYYELGPGPLLKLPLELAAFLELEPLRPLGFVLSWRGVVATAIVGVIAVVALRRAPALAGPGLALLLLPMLPTLLVPYLPGRYTTIPYAGFLLLAAAAAQSQLARAPGSLHRAAAGALCCLGALWLAGQVAVVRADLVDVARVAQAHGRLLAEAGAVATSLPLDTPVVAVRLEGENPLPAIAGSPQGWPKLYYPRPADPYSLIDVAALFDWVAGARPERAARLDRDEGLLSGVPGVVLAHMAGRFEIRSRCPDTRAELGFWRARGAQVKVFVIQR